MTIGAEYVYSAPILLQHIDTTIFNVINVLIKNEFDLLIDTKINSH